MNAAPGSGAGRFETQVQRRLLGGLLFGLFLSALSLIVLQNMTRWAVSERERAVVAQTQAILEHLSAQRDPTAAFAQDRTTARLLWAFPARWAAIYDESGDRVAQAITLSGAELSPARDTGKWPLPGEVALVDATALNPPSLQARGTLVHGGWHLVVAFDGEPVVWARRTVRGLAWFIVAAAATLVILGFLFLRRLLQPIGELTEAARDAGEVVPLSSTPFERWARDEMDHAVQTFTRTIHELRKSSAEIEELRRREKERADVLEVTATTLVRSHPGGLLVVSEDGKLSELNENARLLLGLSRRAEGRPAREVLAGFPELMDALDRAEVGEPSLAVELSVGASPESGRALAFTAVPIAEKEGKPLGTIVFIEDRTDTNRLQRELSTRRELAALGEMSAGIAHEFRNATATILGYARLAATSEDPVARARHLAGVSTEAKHIAKVTGDFLLFARPERLDRSTVDLAALVEEVVAEERLLSAGVELGITGVFQPAFIDPALFRRVLVNLLRNAVEARRPEGRAGRVVVRGLAGEDVSGLIQIAVEDDGEGVPEPEAARIFVPFYSTKESGTGLGLALVAKIMALHGGTVSVDRSAELLGARFILTFSKSDGELESSALPAVTRSGIRIRPIEPK